MHLNIIPYIQAQNQEEIRDQSNKWGPMTFIANALCLTLSLSVVLETPILALKSGHSEFWIVYAVTTLALMGPIFWINAALGQFHQKGVLAVWSFSKGRKKS